MAMSAEHSRRKGCRGRTMMVLVVLLMAALPGFAASGTTTLTLEEKVFVDEADVVLGQLGTLTGVPARTTADLQTLPIGRAPLPGHSRTVSRDYILLRLRQSGLDTGDLSVAGPQEVTLVRRAVTLTTAELEMMVRDFVTAHPPISGADMSITGVRIPGGDVLLPTGNIHQQMEYLPQGGSSGTLPVNIFFSIDDEPVKRLLATVSVVVMKEVPVTRNPIARYQLVQPDDLMLQTMDVAGLPANTVLTYEDIAGQRARRSIGPQRVLRKDQFEFPPVVKRGDRVVIVAESAGLRVTTIGEVQNTGRIGERVRVMNLDSNKTLHARVVDARTVRVQY